MNKREARKFDQLYTKFLRELKLQGYAEVTIDAYTRGIRRVAEQDNRGQARFKPVKEYKELNSKTISYLTPLPILSIF